MSQFIRFATVCAFVLCLACSGKDPGGASGSGADGGPSGGGSAGDGTTGGGSGSGTGTGTGVLGADGGTDGLGVTDPNWTIPEELQLCGGPCQCADGIDNDGDGTADGFDIECTGPGDNDEGTFATGISGDNMDPKWQDCFFDGNSGGGDDMCRYATGCITGDLEQSDPDCQLAQNCIDFCTARTPNGCDCFGCCEVQDGSGGTMHVLLSTTCDADDLSKCQTCVPSTQCQNTCGECELCTGQTAPDLPDTCGGTTPGGGGTGGTSGTAGTSGGTSGAGGTTGTSGTSGGTSGTGGTGGDAPFTCEGGFDVCLSNADCNAGSYCGFGCCLPIPPT